MVPNLKLVADFSPVEKISLWGLLAAFLLPQSWFAGVFYNHEFAMALFVAVAAARVPSLLRLLPLFLVLSVPLVLGHLFPIYRPDFDLRVSLLNYTKLCLFAGFVYTLVHRCRSQSNLILLIRRVVLPVSLVFAVSATIDRYTSNTFFMEWHKFWDVSGPMRSQIEDAVDFLFVDEISSNGFAGRATDVVTWSVLGLAGIIWLVQARQVRPSMALGVITILLFAAFSMPQRGAIIIVGVTVIVYVIAERKVARFISKPALLVIAVTMLLIGNAFGERYSQSRESAASMERVGTTALSRAINFGMVDQARYTMIIDQIDDFSERTRLLVVGCGWDYGGGAWSKPHNTYIAIIVGGGLVSLVALIAGLACLLRRSRLQKRTFAPGALGLALLVALSVDLVANGHLYANTEYPAGLLAMAVAMSTILYQCPPNSVFTGGQRLQ